MPQQDWRTLLARFAFVVWLALTCLLSWPLFAGAPRGALWPLLAQLGPAAAAAILIAVLEGGEGFRRLSQGFLVRWRHLPWLVIALMLPVLLVVPTLGAAVVTGAWFELALAPVDDATIILVALLPFTEAAWRGYALPLLLRETTPLIAAVVAGFAFALWTLPLFLAPASPYTASQFGVFMLLALSTSVLATWLWLKSRGSLWVSIALHAMMMLVTLAATPAERLLPTTAIYALIALLLSLGRTLRRPAAVAAVQDEPVLA